MLVSSKGGGIVATTWACWPPANASGAGDAAKVVARSALVAPVAIW